MQYFRLFWVFFLIVCIFNGFEAIFGSDRETLSLYNFDSLNF